jgi:hypothetical protein
MAYIGNAPAPTDIQSGDIADGTLTNADISASAAIEVSKLNTTVTTAELNYLSGAQSSIQTQIDANTTKLAGIETGATADQTGAEIKSLYEAEANTNAFTDAEKTKLSGVEANATADQTASEILAAIITVDGAGSSLDADFLDGKQLATIESEYQAYADAAAAGIVDSAPAALDTLNELAAALGDDANFSTTVTNSIATKVAKAGDTMTGTLAFGDSVKATFGTSADLEIYHDGSNSYISDVGTGVFLIQGDSDIWLQNSTGTASYARFTNGGAVTLYHNNSVKFQTTTGGVSVTGDMYASGRIGLDDGDQIAWSNNAHCNIAVNGATRVRIESDGDLHADGDVIAYSTTISDPRLKTDIQKIEGALDKLCTLSGYTFTYTPDGTASAGILSTEVAEVLPSAIRPKKLPLKTGDDETVYDTVQYDQLHGLLIEAIKELREEVADLKAKIGG